MKTLQPFTVHHSLFPIHHSLIDHIHHSQLTPSPTNLILPPKRNRSMPLPAQGLTAEQIKQSLSQFRQKRPLLARRPCSRLRLRCRPCSRSSRQRSLHPIPLRKRPRPHHISQHHADGTGDRAHHRRSAAWRRRSRGQRHHRRHRKHHARRQNGPRLGQSASAPSSASRK